MTIVKSLLAAAVVVFAVALAAPVQADAATYSTPQGALKGSLREEGMLAPRVACDRVSTRRWACSWTAFQSGVGTCWGEALVTRRYRWHMDMHIDRPASLNGCGFYS